MARSKRFLDFARNDKTLLQPFGDKFWVSMNVDLPQRRIAGIGEAVRCAGGNHDDVARAHFTLFRANRTGSTAFLHQDQFIVVMAMKSDGLTR